MNENGNTIVGWTNVDPTLGGTLAALWSGAIKPITYDGMANGASSSAARVSGDGLVVVGTATDENFHNRAVYWKTTDVQPTPAAIDPDTYIYHEALGVSGDGKVIVGQFTRGPTVVAFRWTTGKLSLLPDYTTGSTSSARGVSDDGRVIVGSSGGQAVRWIDNATPELLKTVGNAYAANADGSIIVGVIGNPTSGSSLAFIWDAANGVRSLNDVLTSLGVVLGSFSLSEATDVSDDGNVVVGWGTDGASERAWVVNLAGTSAAGP